MRKQDPKKQIHQPDDQFFKFVMLEKEHAIAYIQNFYPQLAEQFE
ncbi:MAG: hypothetical protein AAFO94_06600 [Bacteroidota bacterium]